MAIPQNQVPANAQEMVLNLAKALGLEIEIKGAQEEIEAPQQEVKHRKPKKLPKALSQEQTERLLAPIRTKCNTGLRSMAMLQTMLKAGLRISEVTSLTPADIDLSKGMILVQNGKGNKDRMVPIGEGLIEWLIKWDNIRPQNATYFFCAMKGTQLLPRYINQVLERLSNESGVFIQDGAKKGPVHCHCLRHTYATNLLRSGLSLPQIQKLMGHSSIAITEIYLYVEDEELDAAVKALG